MKKTIALVAHDSCKKELLDWVSANITKLEGHDFYATGTTGRIVSEVLKGVKCLKSGPLGGDQQLGALISDEKIDYLIFFWDPMANQPHDVDVKALLRLSVLYNIPTACNRATADFLISSALFADKNYHCCPINPFKRLLFRTIKQVKTLTSKQVISHV